MLPVLSNSLLDSGVFSSKGEIRLGGQEHFYMETQSMLAVPKGEEQEMDISVSIQYPRGIQVTWGLCGKNIAKWFLPAKYTKSN